MTSSRHPDLLGALLRRAGGAGSSSTIIAGTAAGASGIDPALIQAKGDLIAGREVGVPDRLEVGAEGEVLVVRAAEDLGVAWEAQYATIVIALLDVFAPGVKIDFQVDFACEIEGWTMLADAATTARIDLWGDVFANYPPTIADTFPGGTSNRPQLAAAASATGGVAGWTKTAIAAGDTIRVNQDSNDVATRLTLTLKVRRT